MNRALIGGGILLFLLAFAVGYYVGTAVTITLVFDKAQYYLDLYHIDVKLNTAAIRQDFFRYNNQIGQGQCTFAQENLT